jgi:hypothetical protein
MGATEETTSSGAIIVRPVSSHAGSDPLLKFDDLEAALSLGLARWRSLVMRAGLRELL